ncbi:hypothetical protein O181_015067 [Austropuccinia psidii MF-1]|uniref:CCHC-type domain-containing protein n=1 Tax=Austropuccinia psidii MF-1 TaxID=1389203 RepID=A0A9Q3C2X1_9BASI|nr:hypothetical protein [Austropuccinia psidii MF-1]
MELIDYIDGLFIDVPSIPDYWITARINTEFKGHFSIWYTEMKEINGRRNWPWWKSQIIQKYSNSTLIWQKTISFENDKYSVYKDTYEWCFRKLKRLKAIYPQMNIQMRNHKLLTKMPGELDHEVKCRCDHNCILEDIANTLQDTNPKKAEVIKKKNTCHNCGSTDHYANRCPKTKKKFYAIEKVPEEESPTEDFESASMGDAIREQSDEEQDTREEFLVEYPEETLLEIQDIQVEGGIPQDTENKNLCKHTQDSQTFLVTPTKGMAYIHWTVTKITVCIDNAQHPLIIDSGAQFSIVARNYLGHHLPNWKKQLFPTKAKNFKSASGNITSIGTIIKHIIVFHRKGAIRLNPEFFYLKMPKSKGFYWEQTTRGYNISSHDPLEKLLNGFREGQLNNTLTSKQKLGLLKLLRKNGPAFSIGEEPLGRIRGHDIQSYLDVERPYPPMLRRPPYPESLETREEIEKHINELLEMDVIRKIGHNDIVEIATPVLITWNDGKSRLCGDFRALNNYTKAYRYPNPRIPHALDKLAKAKYIPNMDCMKGFHNNGVKPNSMKVLRIICHMGIYEYIKMPFGIKNAPAHFQRMIDTILQEEILEGWIVIYIDDIIIYSETWEDHVQYIDRVLRHKVLGLSLSIDQNKVAAVLQKPLAKNIKEIHSLLGFASYYRNHIRKFSHMTSSPYKFCSKDVLFEITKEGRDAYERIKHELTNAPVPVLPDFELPFKLYIDAACSQGLGAALHQKQIVDGKQREGVICYISRKLKDS